MKRVTAHVVLRGHVMDVRKDRLSSADPVNEAIEIARRSGRGPYSEDVDRYNYEAHEHGDHYSVTTAGHATGVGTSVEDAARSVDRGSFEEKEVADWRGRDVEDALVDGLTVADLRDLGREHDVSYRRGSRKRGLARQLIDQAPDVAFRLAGP